MSSIILSIIIPCYNVENFIYDCLNSLYDQNIPECDYEIICVNDCSKDKTQEIIKCYIKDHTNLFLINLLTNKKQGVARNTGLMFAKGDYIWFIDSDDWIEPKCLSEIRQYLNELKVDILSFNYKKQGKNKIFTTANDFYETGIIPGKSLLEKTNIWEHGVAVRRIYSHKYLKKNNFKFPEIGYLEDMIFSIRSIYYSERFIHINRRYYNYVWNSNSTTNKPIEGENALSIASAISELFKLSSEIKNMGDISLSLNIHFLALDYANKLAKWIIFMKNGNRMKLKALISNDINQIINSNFIRGWRRLIFKYMDVSFYLLFVLSPIIKSIRHLKRKLF